LRKCSIAIQATKNEIKGVEQPPPPVLQPLPMQEDRALPVLFFLRMSETLQIFSRLSFIAQQVLLPRAPVSLADGGCINAAEVDSQIRVDKFNTGWVEYYMHRSTDRAYQAVYTNVQLGADEKMSTRINPSGNVRQFHTPSDCVWHPDTLNLRLFWNGGNFPLDIREGYFNPFAPLPPGLLIATFTEQLKPLHTDLRWAVLQSGSEAARSRGNVAEATQGARPDWLPTKASYLSFGALRAYPNQQMCKLCRAPVKTPFHQSTTVSRYRN